jgi:hypothetical protein
LCMFGVGASLEGRRARHDAPGVSACSVPLLGHAPMLAVEAEVLDEREDGLRGSVVARNWQSDPVAERRPFGRLGSLAAPGS